MKDKWKKFREWMTKVRKQALISAIALLLVISGVIGGAMLMDRDRKVQASKETELSKGDITPEETPEAETGETLDQAEAGTAADAIGGATDVGTTVSADAAKAAEEKKAAETQAAQEEEQQKTVQAEQNSQTQQNTSKPESQRASSSSGSSGSSKQRHQHNYNIPIYGEKKVYVVDQKAWTETVEEPVYEQVERCICNGCGADITGNMASHAKENMLAGNTACGGWHSEVKQVQTGTTTKTIDHPEQGHYETESYVSGYKCSCGAAK